MAMIEDEMLRGLFRAESEEHLGALDAGLMRLEQAPDDRALLDELFREAHSLKGAARMLGLDRLQALAHGFEDLLAEARQGTGGPGAIPGIARRLGRSLGALSALSREAVGGEPADVDVARVLADMTAADTDRPVTQGETAPRPALSRAATPSRAEAPLSPHAGGAGIGGLAVPPPGAVTDRAAAGEGEAAGAAVPEAGSGAAEPRTAEPKAPDVASGDLAAAYRVETVRVGTERLDALLANASELSVTRGRILRRLGELDALLAAGADPSLQRVRRLLGEDGGDLERIAGQIVERVRELRLVPLSTLFRLFPRFVRELGADKGKPVELLVTGGDTAVDKRIVEEMKDPLTQLLRNAVDHGIEPAAVRQARGKPAAATIRLSAGRVAGQVVIEVADDGAGLDHAAIVRAAVARGDLSEAEAGALAGPEIERLIFRPGLSSAQALTDTSGRGVGMDVVAATVERLEGSIELASRPGEGLAVRIRLPLALGATRLLLVRCGGVTYGLPMEDVAGARFLDPEMLSAIGGHRVARIGDETLPVASLAALLGTAGAEILGRTRGRLPCVMVASLGQRLGLVVDEVVAEEEVVLRPQGPLLRRACSVAGAALLDTGEVCTVLRPADLVAAAAGPAGRIAVRADDRAPAAGLQPVEATHGTSSGAGAGAGSQAASGHGPALPAAATVRQGGGRRGHDGPRTVLLAEDSITTRTQERRILEGAGYRVIVAVDGLDALEKLEREPVHAVVSDIDMPGLDGLSLTRRIREHPAWRGLPVVLVSSLASDEDKRAGLEAGANAYIAKSAFDQSVLLDCLARLA